MCITFRSIVTPIVFVILSILLLPFPISTTKISTTTYVVPISDRAIYATDLGIYVDRTILFQIDQTLCLLYPNGTFNLLDNINNINTTLAYPLNPNYILIEHPKEIMIIDWTGNIITKMNMKPDPSLKINTSKQNDSRFLVSKNNQTHLLFTEYTFNGGQIISSMTNKLYEENVQCEINKVISLGDKWGVVYTVIDRNDSFLLIIPIENKDDFFGISERVNCVDDNLQLYCLSINDYQQLMWINSSLTNFSLANANSERLYPSIDFTKVKADDIHVIPHGFLIRIDETEEVLQSRYLVINAFDPNKTFGELIIDWDVLRPDNKTSILLQGFILPNNTIVHILIKEELLIFASADFSLMIPESMHYFIYFCFIITF